MAFFLKLSYSKVRASFTHLGRGGHLNYFACNVSYTLRYMFVDPKYRYVRVHRDTENSFIYIRIIIVIFAENTSLKLRRHLLYSLKCH